MTRLIVALAALFCVLAPAAHAEVYCVGTAAELRTAISDAAGSSSASEIRVRNGFYSLPAASSTAVSLNYSANSDLTMSGGWSGSNGLCTNQQTTPETTVLSAAGVGRLLNFYLLSGMATHIDLSNFSFRQGDLPAGQDAAACLTIESDVGADAIVTIDRNAFRLCNRASGSGSALLVRARSADIYLRNNVFADNASSAAAVYLQALGSSVLYASNNTIANNPQLGIGGGPGGMQITAQPSDIIWFSNNVLWNNGTGSGYDLLIGSGTPIVLNSNLIGDMPPPPASAVNNNTLATDPGFTNSVDFRPLDNSPMRNSGASPNGGSLALDFDLGIRVQGTRIDRGAYEFSEVFSNGFE